jgi:peptidoglycan/xylan/chitin deacetylase (PgdA/CDA1 family)
MTGSTLKSCLKTAFYRLSLHAGPVALRNAWLRLRRRTRCTVLLYHRVNDLSQDNLTTSTRRFAEHLSTLARHYPVLSLWDAFEAMRAGRYLGPNVVVITFDDGYADNYDAAAPILERFGLPASFFVTVGHVNTSRALEHDARSQHRFANLSWEAIRSLDGRGFEIGSHGWSHKNLAHCPLDDARREILESRDLLARELGHTIRAFAYPFGAAADITPDVVREIRDAGFQMILSAYGGANVGTMDPLDVRRVGVSQAFDALGLRAKIEGFALQSLRRQFYARILRRQPTRPGERLDGAMAATSGRSSAP